MWLVTWPRDLKSSKCWASLLFSIQINRVFGCGIQIPRVYLFRANGKSDAQRFWMAGFYWTPNGPCFKCKWGSEKQTSELRTLNCSLFRCPVFNYYLDLNSQQKLNYSGHQTRNLWSEYQPIWWLNTFPWSEYHTS